MEKKKSDKVIVSPIVDTYLDKIIVTFDASDIAGILDFCELAECAPCRFEQDENVFTIIANTDTLYHMIYILARDNAFIRVI